ncbi:MAG: thiamine-phosphate kinase [Arcobacteraceae bacterium]|jgi:thiamine-monophosphate kinase|nr:thiamine-phosphate kinase [Arcobacteraceae bacterium]
MNKENYFITKIASNQFIGDDGAVILEKLKKNENYVYSMDAFFENVHFKREWLSLKEIAIKSMLVNISDAIVMNATPKYALLSIAIPSDFTTENLDELALGFKKIAKKYNITIIGGDTIANTKLDISITIISITKKPIYRSGAKKDDLVCYTGELGRTKEDLEKLLKGETIDKNSKFIKPKLHKDFFYEVAPFINCALDISDGLFFELERLSKVNKLGFHFLEGIPNAIGCSGEEYEILFTFSKKKKKKIEAIASKYNLPLNIFAKVIEGEYKCKCKGHHF